MRMVILDRDGVINYDSPEYIRTEDDWKAIPGSLEAIAALKRADYHVAVVSNQSGIGQGLLTVDDLNAIHNKLNCHLAQYNGYIDAFFFCPHLPRDRCSCRKPKPGLLRQVAERFGITLDTVSFIGDRRTDMEAALAAKARPILVRSGPERETLNPEALPPQVMVYENLQDAVQVLLS